MRKTIQVKRLKHLMLRWCFIWVQGPCKVWPLPEPRADMNHVPGLEHLDAARAVEWVSGPEFPDMNVTREFLDVRHKFEEFLDQAKARLSIDIKLGLFDVVSARRVSKEVIDE